MLLNFTGQSIDITQLIKKPDVTLYEEPLNEIVVKKTIDEISKADTLIVAGTSLTVYPAASYLNYFKGKYLVVINREMMRFDYFIQGNVGEIVDQIDI